MGISGSTKALMESRMGEARFGATRFGYATPTPHITINSVDATQYVEIESIRWSEDIDDRIDRLNFTMRAGGQSAELTSATAGPPKQVELAIGDVGHVEFRGIVQKVTIANKQPGQTAGGKVWKIEARDFKRDLQRMLVTRKYVSKSASFIALDLLTAGAEPPSADDSNRVFTGNNIQTGLATIDEISFKFTPADKAIQRLAERIGAFWYIDRAADLHFFTSETVYSPRDLDADDSGYWDLEMSQDDTDTITQALLEGKGDTIASDVTVGDSTVPLNEADLFDGTGGSAIIGNHRFIYTGISTNTLTGVTWDYTDPATVYEVGEYVGQVYSGVLSGAPTSTYQNTKKFHRDRRMTATEAADFATALTQDYHRTARYKTDDLQARVGAQVTINRTTSHFGASYTGTILKQTTRWKSKSRLVRSVQVGERTRNKTRSFFDNQGSWEKD